MLCAAGSPLPIEGYVWLHEQFGTHAPIYVGSGGTDVCTGLVQGYPIVPVYAGEMSAKCLGVAAYAFDDEGNSVVGELGELVIVEPMPSMPVRFWGDVDMARYRSTYFEHYPGVMRFGDWVRFTEHGTAVVTGRSDATLNRGGVRIGTAEIYRVVEQMDEIVDSLVVHLEDPSGGLGRTDPVRADRHRARRSDGRTRRRAASSDRRRAARRAVAATRARRDRPVSAACRGT